MENLYKNHKIELLSPAKNLACGIAAINHGADAVYIGAPQFGARASASNSVADIEKLCNYAHLYNAKVYIALNTILYDSEIKKAVEIAYKVYNVGADALIIQDMGLLECELPPIQIHASTQTNNQTPQKVKFLEDVGFSQVVLARELNLKQIKDIRANTSIPLEFFVHGALCVSYSGQCYVSEAIAKRSANRGECAQFCRHSWKLTDENNKVIEKNKFLLSLKDLNNSDNLEQLIDAGISSFKIEGRLKDENYVKNITAYYRNRLDAILENRQDLSASSSGKATFIFEPDTAKSFSRGSTDYYLNAIRKKNASLYSPKSLGEHIGTVISSNKDYLICNTSLKLNNGDGLCFIDSNNNLFGFNINKIDGKKIYSNKSIPVVKNVEVFRNFDIAFNKLLQSSNNCRKIAIWFELFETDDGFLLKCIDEDENTVEKKHVFHKEPAKNIEKAIDNIKQQLSKLGNTIFYFKDVRFNIQYVFFIPNSVISDLRRDVCELLYEKRISNYKPDTSSISLNNTNWIKDETSYFDNISNKKAEEFYLRHGAKNIKPAFENMVVKPNSVVMTTKYCIKYELGFCPVAHPKNANKYTENLYISDNKNRFRLEFDCVKCEMKVIY